MPNRRDFLKQSAVFTGAALGTFSTPTLVASSRKESQATSGMVPDTLDLARHGELAINGILGSLNPNLKYETIFLGILDVHPTYLLHWSSMISGVMPKFIEALPLLRFMSGSKQDMDIEKGLLEAMIENMSEDGLVYDRALPERPWNVSVRGGDLNVDYANLAGNGRMVAGFLFKYQATGEKRWKKLAEKTAERILELTIIKGNHAYYPNPPGLGNDFSYIRETGWPSTEPPKSTDEGWEGATLFYLLQPVRGLMRWYQNSGDERFLDVSRKLIAFSTQKQFWGGKSENPNTSAERGHFHGHFHGTLAALRAILDYAVVADDTRLKHFVRDAYEWARQRGISRLGIFPHTHEWTEGCTMGDMVGLAVALTDAGMGDYWDDVEIIARNGLVSAQATDMEELKRVSEAGKHRPPYSDWGGHFDTRMKKGRGGVLPGQEIHERALERSVGSFAHLWGARYQIPQTMACCTANCSQALYFSWEGIVRNSGDTATINMWLNRRSPWVDVRSYLPYEGKMVINNKGMRTLVIRKPGRTNHDAVKCSINGKSCQPGWSGNHMVFGGLKGNEELTVEIPVSIEQANYTMINLNQPDNSNEEYRCEFKANTVLSTERIKAGMIPEEYDWYRLFRREHFRRNRAPMKESPDYVHPKGTIEWQV